MENFATIKTRVLNIVCSFLGGCGGVGGVPGLLVTHSFFFVF